MPITRFITQPDERVGDVLIKAVTDKGTPAEFAFVSAFASLTTVMRFKEMAQHTVDAGGTGRLVVGVDLGGTSKQVLQEVASWPVPVFVVKNSMPGITFHPKIYHMRWPDRALIIVGSNNLTDGGLFRNYEAASLIWYDLLTDATAYAANVEQIKRFTEPRPPTGNKLTTAYLASLLALTEIPSEAEARANRKRLKARRWPCNGFSRPRCRRARQGTAVVGRWSRKAACCADRRRQLWSMRHSAQGCWRGVAGRMLSGPQTWDA